MSTELIGVLVLAAVFAVSSLRGLNMGVLALVATFLVGCVWLDHTPQQVLEGFPAEMFVVLVAVTFLFGIARVNGTVEWLVHAAVRVSGQRLGAMPWGTCPRVVDTSEPGPGRGRAGGISYGDEGLLA
ncbi:hypothetical protein ACIRFL_43570, partial [Streptomyces sp. NPDC102462]